MANVTARFLGGRDKAKDSLGKGKKKANAKDPGKSPNGGKGAKGMTGRSGDGGGGRAEGEGGEEEEEGSSGGGS